MLLFGLSLLLASLFAGVFISYSLVSGQASYKIEGYVKDASGLPVAEAYLVFNNLSIPLIETNQQGYYSLNAPAGTYRLDVFPPNDSRFINYWENYAVNRADTKNITLFTGYKISGYVVNASGSPMVGAAVLFNFNSSVIYGSGFLTNQDGYYYANVPAGTYTIDAHPQTAHDSHYQWECTNFQNYTESGLTINSDIVRNITVNSTSPTTTPTPTIPPTPTPQPTTTPTLTATPTPTFTPPTPTPTTQQTATPPPTTEYTKTPTTQPTVTPPLPSTTPTTNSSTDAILLSTQPTQPSPTSTQMDAEIPIVIATVAIFACITGLLLYLKRRRQPELKTKNRSS